MPASFGVFAVFLLWFAAAALFPAPAAAQKADAEKAGPARLEIAVVDVQKILRESAASRTIRPQVDKLKKQYQESFKLQENELRAANQDLNRQRTILSPEAFETKLKAFRRQASSVQRDIQSARRRLDGALGLAMGKVHRSLQLVVAKYAEEKGVMLILPKSGVLLMETRFDVTGEILKRLNARLPSVKVVLPPEAALRSGEKDGNGQK